MKQRFKKKVISDSITVIDLTADYMDVKDIMHMFDISYMSVLNWRQKRKLPSIEIIMSRKKSVIRFSKKQVIAWAKKSGVPVIRK